MTSRFICLFLLLTAIRSFGQDTAQNKNIREQLLIYKKLYDYADSIKKIQSPGFVDTVVYNMASSLDKKHPSEYYLKANEFMKDFKLNEASFLFYVGRLRYRYYNSTNPKYQASSDGALAASLNYGLGEPLNMFLKADINNFIAILKKSVDWYNTHDYQFYSQKKNPEKYADQSNGMQKLIDDLQKNKEKYQSEWDNEKIEFLKNIDSALQ